MFSESLERTLHTEAIQHQQLVQSLPKVHHSTIYAYLPNNHCLYVADSGNYTVRKIDLSSAQVTTLAGSAGNYGVTDGGRGRCPPNALCLGS
jgi:hypothetical protein